MIDAVTIDEARVRRNVVREVTAAAVHTTNVNTHTQRDRERGRDGGRE